MFETRFHDDCLSQNDFSPFDVYAYYLWPFHGYQEAMVAQIFAFIPDVLST